MASGPVRRRAHVLPSARGIQWQLIERPSELLEEQWETGEDVLFEDSEVTVTIDWGDHEPGHLVSGLTILEPMAQTQTVDLHVLDLGSYVGKIQLSLQTEDGQPITSEELEVRRRKLASDRGLAELERHWSTLHLPVEASTERRVYEQAGVRPGDARPAQWAMMVRDMLQPLVTAARSIETNPKHALLEERSDIHARKLRRPSIAPILSTMKGERRVETARPRWEPDPGARAMAARDARRIRKHVRRLRDEIEEAEQELDPELDNLLGRLQRHLGRLARKGDPKDAQQVRQAVLHDGRYRLLHRASLLAKRSVEQVGEGRLKAFRPPTYQLYEEWCTWAIAEELAPAADLSRIHRKLKRPWEEREVLLREEPEPLRLSIQYEMSILGWRHRPDLVLRLDTPQTICILDVKYRGEGEGLVEVPSDAIAELHRYRDAYMVTHHDQEHKEVWSAILHPAPGWEDGDWEQSEAIEGALDESYRIGSVPLSPSLREPLREYLESVLDSE